MKHLTCDPCGKPAPHDPNWPSDPKFYFLGHFGNTIKKDLCPTCSTELSVAIHAKCAELKKDATP